jgi:DNA repair exonuclease SbcCD nuclease subunit
MGFEVTLLAGNHDLEGREASELSNTASALKTIGVKVINETTVEKEDQVVSIPYIHKMSDLLAEIERVADELGTEVAQYCLFIHAPLNRVIKGIPDNGLEATTLAKFGFERIFCGHYHNHVVFDNVISIGALTHQSFSDINSKAGFITVIDDKLEHFETSAPKFVDIEQSIKKGQFEKDVAGNFVRAKLEHATQTQVNGLRDKLITAGAKGVIVTNTAKSNSFREPSKNTSTKASSTIESSIADWIDGNCTEQADKIKQKSLQILREI